MWFSGLVRVRCICIYVFPHLSAKSQRNTGPPGDNLLLIAIGASAAALVLILVIVVLLVNRHHRHRNKKLEMELSEKM